MRGTATPDGSFSDETKRVVLLRARSECELDGRWCGEGAWREFHHRNPRGMGGTGADGALMRADPANCLLLCHLCHRWIESHRTASIAAGWLVEYGHDAREIPAKIYRRGLVLLGAEYRELEAPKMRRELGPGRVRVRW